MARSISSRLKNIIFAPETGEVFVLLLTIEHPDLSDPIRVSTDNRDEFFIDDVKTRGTVSNGHYFIYYPMEIHLPNLGEEIVSSFTITIDNINQEIMRSIRSLNTSPTAKIQIVTASHPDDVEIELPGFTMTDVDADNYVISATLTLRVFSNEPFPGGEMLPSNFAGVF